MKITKQALIPLCIALSCAAMDTDRPANTGKFQAILITNDSDKPVRIYSKLMFRQTWLPKKEAAAEPKGLTGRMADYLGYLWASTPTPAQSMDGNSEEPRGILPPNEITEFTLMLSRTQQHDNSFTFRIKACINLYEPEDRTCSMNNCIASCELSKEPLEAYIITKNADGELVINKAAPTPNT